MERHTVPRASALATSAVLVVAMLQGLASATLGNDDDPTLVDSGGALVHLGTTVTHASLVMQAVEQGNRQLLQEKPDDWPEELRWIPRRYHGPFWRGSTFNDIQIVVPGPSRASWYHNDYFTDNADADRYRPFYPQESLPDNASPTLLSEPGKLPVSDGPNAFAASLDRIDYSSRYGGTIRLLFRVSDDVGIDLRHGDYAWDLGDLEMRVYVTPTAKGLTGPGTAYHQGAVHLEIQPASVVAYSVPPPGTLESQGSSLRALGDPREGELAVALDTLASDIASDVAPDARRFVGGFLHALFPDRLGLGWVVDGIDISDGYIDPLTRQGIPVVRLSFRVSDIYGYQGYHPFEGDLEFRLRLMADHVYDGWPEPGPRATYYVDQDEDTPWLTAGQWTVEELGILDSVGLTVFGFQVDDLSADEPFDAITHRFEIKQTDMQAHHDAENYGLIEENRHRLSPTWEGDDFKSLWYYLDTRLYLGLR